MSCWRHPQESLFSYVAVTLVVAAAALLSGCMTMQGAMMKMMPESMKESMMNKMMANAESEDPDRGYLDAHDSVTDPLGLLGGPVHVKIAQTVGGVFVGLPDNRKLDTGILGPPDKPMHYGGTPVMLSVPSMMYQSASGGGYQLMMKTPFGDDYDVLPNGKLQLEALDATATDAATTKDWVHMDASWQDKEGNTYEVKCCSKMAAHGVDYPTFGGVVTNHLLHGFTNIGTPLMPTEFTYFAFDGTGDIYKNGKIVAGGRPIHGMLTEYVRTTGYALGFDKDVTPTRQHFHLVTPPMVPNSAGTAWDMSPVTTGYTLPDGKELPFWHVMFENLQVQASHG